MYTYSDQQNHDSQLEYQRFQTLINTRQTLIPEEYEFCVSYDPKCAEHFFYNKWEKIYINFNTYSESDKEDSDFRKELGI